MKFFRKDWILYEEVGNEGGTLSKDLLEVNIKTDDPEVNKHIPFISEVSDGYNVKVGKNEYHVEDEKHHTIFIQLIIDNEYIFKKYIKQGEKPDVTFKTPKGKKVEALAFCNLHGMWKFSL